MRDSGRPEDFYISRVLLTGALAGTYEVEAPEDRTLLAPTRRITLLLGPNNSGKSRLLRHLYTTIGDEHTCLGDVEGRRERLRKPLLHLAEKMRGAALDVFRGSNDERDIRDAGNSLQKLVEDQRQWSREHLEQLIAKVETVAEACNREKRASALGKQCQQRLDELRREADRYGDAPLDIAKIYVPVLRSCRRMFTGKSTPMLRQAVEEELLVDRPATAGRSNRSAAVGRSEIFTGEDLYGQFLERRLGDRAARTQLDEFEAFLSRWFFQGQNVQIIPSASDPNKGSVVLKVGKEKERPIHELGDGLQQVMILSWPLFAHSDKDVVMFIEEPELFLHPGMQRQWVQMLLERAKSHDRLVQVFATTHSNHLVDLTLDHAEIAVHRVEKRLHGKREDDDEQEASFAIVPASPVDRTLLECLGVHNSSVHLSNCTIWVEGITDRLYLRHYLRLFVESQKPSSHFVEDLHYSFIEYGGSNITHWSFLDEDTEEPRIDVGRLRGRLLLIIDTDDRRWKHERAADLERALGSDHFIRLPCREVENLIAPHVLTAVVREYERVGDDSDHVKTPDAAEYVSAPLGKFIEESMLRPESQKRRGRYRAESGTVNDKLGFASKTIARTASWDDVSPRARELAERIHRFIAGSNPPTVR